MNPQVFQYTNADCTQVTDNQGWTGLVTVEHVQEWIAKGNTPAAYAAPVPAALIVTPFQIREALNQQGLRSQVEAAIAASANQSIKDAWEFAQIFVEDDGFVKQIATSLNLTAAQVHALFALAITLNP